MQPAMSGPEKALLTNFLSCTQNYVEFGCGGSTALASRLVRDSIISVDSSTEWLERVFAYCASVTGGLQPTLCHIDIGPVKALGFPSDPSTQSKWPAYHGAIWDKFPHARSADTFLIDGRFRVACFLQTLLHCSNNAVLIIHDYANREEYHAIEEFAQAIARSDNLSVFQRKANFNPDALQKCLHTSIYDAR
jgi:hypothetical protein